MYGIETRPVYASLAVSDSSSRDSLYRKKRESLGTGLIVCVLLCVPVRVSYLCSIVAPLASVCMLVKPWLVVWRLVPVVVHVNVAV